MSTYYHFVVLCDYNNTMKGIKITLLLIAILLLFASCSTSLTIPYNMPSNVDMSNYRNIAISSTAPSQTSYSVPLYIRLDISDSTIDRYFLFSSYDYNSVNKKSASEVDKMLEKVFSSSSYYSVLPREKTDAYVSLYKIGKDPSSYLQEDGIDALIVPKITSLITDEYITAKKYTDSSTGSVKTTYYIHRRIDISLTLTVLDTKTNSIVCIKDYRTSDYDYESFDPSYYLFDVAISTEDLVARSISSFISDIVADFIPTKQSTSISLKSNKPKIESVESAYKAAEDGNYEYALKLFTSTYKEYGHVPSAYNASVLLASMGKTDEALSILSDIRNKTNDSDINTLYSKLTVIKERNERAEEQLSNSGDKTVANTNNPYSYLFN